MLSLSLNLPTHRLSLNLSRRRKADIEEGAIFPSLEELKNTRSGDKVSRFFRHVFEHKNIRKILGSNLAFVLIASSIIPASASAYSGDIQEETVIGTPITMETATGIHYPVEAVKFNQRYSFFHPGIDFGAPKGSVVMPIMAGRIAEAGWDITGYGNRVIVDHGDGLTSLYAHLSKITVKIGDEVSTFTKIGEVGSTGRSTGPHLHLEVRKNDLRQNPMSYLPKLN